MEVTEFYAIFTYKQLDNARYEYRDLKCIPDLAEEPCMICSEVFGEPETTKERNKQRIAVTSCFHLFHEACIQEYINGIFREYVAAAYGRIQGMNEQNNFVTLLPDHLQRNLFSLNPELNPFGRAEPNGIYTLRKTTCPLCRHPLDQRLAPNTDMKRCFIRYFMRKGLVYPDLVPRIVFNTDFGLQWYEVVFILDRGVGENTIRLRNRTNTRDFYDIAANRDVNLYFPLPNVRARCLSYLENQTDLSVLYADVVGEEQRPSKSKSKRRISPPPIPPPIIASRLLPVCNVGRGGDLDVAEAKELLARRGLSTKGNKPELCGRLVANNLAVFAPANPVRRPIARSPIPINAELRRCSNGKKRGNDLSLDEAKDLLRRARLPTSGNKEELCRRLRQNGLCL